MLDYRMNTFLTLCREMNYRKTAEALNMTQPAVTQHIHFLEDYYSCRLFEYDRHVLRLTEKGQLLKVHAENLRYQEQSFEKRLRGDGKITLRIGATKTIGEYVIKNQLSAFLSDERHCAEVYVDNTEKLLGLLKEGKLDFALVEGFFDGREFASKLYSQERFRGLCAKNHPFAGKTVTLPQLLEETLIVREEGSGTRKILERELEEHNLTLGSFRAVNCVNSFSLICALIEAGRGISFAYSAVKEHSDNLASFELEGMNLSHSYCYVYLDNPQSLDAVELFDSFRNEDKA